MKKLLTLLGSVTLIATTSAAVIACGGTRSEQKTTDTKEKDDKEKSKEKKEEFKSVLSDKTKEEASKLINQIIDLTDNGEEEMIKNKDEISKDAVKLLDEIIVENNKDVKKTIENFKEKLINFTSPFFVGDLLGNITNSENEEDSIWVSEIEMNGKKEEIVGIVFNSDPKKDLIKESNEITKEATEEDDKRVKDIISDYKKYLAEYKKIFEEETEEIFTKLKDLLTKDLSSTTLK
ncbi:putative lipoprotein [Mycoplasma leachii PG50]|uniref:Putative lipoprotein n=1 Tax=Mycoplasma leachii (strain DSM 21131 / NCTC 10133 / N29 / PG50) TaxID=880447 RepID=E4PU56_MYCLG|nr:lipoprotein [Mycoplasma leachii]ADR24642.1 putative lipoprotein [Mycoplasma leachii PG50]CBV66979.1 Lipoprotein, putative [Mycoplasma leachii 99/014/6]